MFDADVRKPAPKQPGLERGYKSGFIRAERQSENALSELTCCLNGLKCFHGFGATKSAVRDPVRTEN